MNVRSMPCSSCPYRVDVPSGVWAFEEYERLRGYDAPTGSQPLAVFACHATPTEYCHGWAVTHSNRGHAFELLALRLRGEVEIPEPGVALFDSGNEAADHGQREIRRPSPAARATVERLQRKYERLR